MRSGSGSDKKRPSPATGPLRTKIQWLPSTHGSKHKHPGEAQASAAASSFSERSRRKRLSVSISRSLPRFLAPSALRTGVFRPNADLSLALPNPCVGRRRRRLSRPAASTGMVHIPRIYSTQYPLARDRVCCSNYPGNGAYEHSCRLFPCVTVHAAGRRHEQHKLLVTTKNGQMHTHG